MPLFPLTCFLILAAFLACLGLFALAVTKVVAPDGRGHARGFGGGLAALLALFLLCGLGVAGLAAAVTAMALGSARDWNPIERIELSRERDGSERDASSHHGSKRDDDGAVSARVTVRGDHGELLERLDDVLDLDLDELGEHVSVERREGEGGREFSVYEFRLPIREDELERLERDLDDADVRLPDRVDVRFEGERSGRAR